MEFIKEKLYFITATEVDSILQNQLISIDNNAYYFDTTDRGFYMKESDLIKIFPKGVSSIERIQFVGYVYEAD